MQAIAMANDIDSLTGGALSNAVLSAFSVKITQQFSSDNGHM